MKSAKCLLYLQQTLKLMEVLIFYSADPVCLTHIINTLSIKTRVYEMISCKIAKTTHKF